MVLELHIWGPAFGLPSIDPQCLATVAYLSLALSRNKKNSSNGDGADEWVLVADSDTGAVPTNELPALWTGSRWISRFRNIIDFLKQSSGGEWDLDQWMDDKERAECTAFSSFLELHGQSLIDLSLYVSSQNYSSATIPAYGSILQWPNQWIVPPRARLQAKSRTEHLGLSSLDMDDQTWQGQGQGQEQDGRQLPTASSLIPRNLTKKPRETVSGLLNKSSSQSRIRLEGITETFVDPLMELLSQKRNGGYLLSEDTLSSLDCLALGYLALAVTPELPLNWLRESIKDKSPGLVEYTERLRAQCFPGGNVDVSAALEGVRTTSSGVSSLPWQAPERIGLSGIGLRALEGIADTIPVVRDIRAGSRIHQFSRDMTVDEERTLVMQVVKTQQRELYTSAATVLAGIGVLAWYIRSASRASS